MDKVATFLVACGMWHVAPTWPGKTLQVAESGTCRHADAGLIQIPGPHDHERFKVHMIMR